MKVILTAPVEIALQTLGPHDRDLALSWIRRLEDWHTDAALRARSYKLSPSEGTYVVHTNTDIRIFFALEPDTITVLDVAKRTGILTFGTLAGAE